MLPASNRGVGGTVAFPDVCLTPMAPSPIPVPYPNFGFTAMSVPFSPKVLFTMVNAINMSTNLLLTTGDEGGVAHPTFKGPARFTMGNPIVHIHFLPAIMMCSLSNGNNFNAPLGGTLIPSVTNVFLTRREGDAAAAPLRQEREAKEHAPLVLAVNEFSAELATLVFRSAAELDDSRGMVLDLRGCPGGQVDAALQLADDFLPDGCVLAQRIDEEGDGWPLRGRRPQAYTMPLALLVDQQTASAAEIFASALQFHGRALVFGDSTYGKGSARRLTGGPTGATWAAGGSYARPDGQPIEHVGLTPDHTTPNPLEEAMAWLSI